MLGESRVRKGGVLGLLDSRETRRDLVRAVRLFERRLSLLRRRAYRKHEETQEMHQHAAEGLLYTRSVQCRGGLIESSAAAGNSRNSKGGAAENMDLVLRRSLRVSVVS
jgi:hypothetical protein